MEDMPGMTVSPKTQINNLYEGGVTLPPPSPQLLAVGRKYQAKHKLAEGDLCSRVSAADLEKQPLLASSQSAKQ